MRKRSTVLLLVAIGCLFTAAVAYAAVDVAFNVNTTTKKAGKGTGLKVTIKSGDPGVPFPNQVPPIMNRIQIKLNAGGQYNPTKFPSCSASAASLTANVEACPGGNNFSAWFQECGAELPCAITKKPKCTGSCMGYGTGVGYTDPLLVDSPISAQLAMFNGSKKGGKSRVLVFVFPSIGPTFVSEGKVTKKKQGAFDYLLDFNIPPIIVPNAPNASVGTVNTITLAKKTKKKGKTYNMIVTPKKCNGKWKAQGKFFYKNETGATYNLAPAPPGGTITKDITQSCTKTKKK